MLLFIIKADGDATRALNFNTSHVTVYQLVRASVLEELIFQYISCYCLSVLLTLIKTAMQISIHLMLLFIVLFQLHYRLDNDFNTSHVTVYQKVKLVMYVYTDFNTSHVTVYLTS